MAHPDRKGGGGLSARTLAIASAASLTAAMVTSRLFPPGTVYASALTPVIVAAVSELLNRPVERVTKIRRERQTVVMDSRRFEAARVQGEEAVPLSIPDDFHEEDLSTNGSGEHAPMRVYSRKRSRMLHPKVWIATGLAAFAIAVAVLTLPELIFGGSVASSSRTTFFGGSSRSSSTTKTDTQTTPTQTTTTTQTTVTQTVPSTTPTTTATTPTTTDTGTTTSPSGGTAPPTDTSTGTGTTTVPSGAVPPTP